MPTLGDYLHNFREFLTLSRSPAEKRPMQLRGGFNPVINDAPQSGRYGSFENWKDERKARAAMLTSWSYSGINRIARAALSSNLMVRRRAAEGSEDIINHPVEMLVQDPNSDMDREYLWLYTVYSLYLKAAYWFLYPDSSGNIAELWPIPFQKVRPIPNDQANPESLFAGFVYLMQGGKEIILPTDNVIYIRFPHPFDVYDAWPPLSAFLKPVILDNAQADWNTRHFDKNRGLPTSITSVPAEISQPQFEEVKREIRKHHGENMIVRAGTISVDFMQESHKDMEFLDARKFNREEIYEVLGVPMDLSSKESWRWFISNTVWPTLQMIAGQITTQITKPYYGDDIFAEFEDIRPQDRSMEVQEAVQYWPSFSINETRIQRNLEPFPAWSIETDIEALDGKDLMSDVPIRLIDQIIPILTKGKPEPVPPQLQGFQGVPSMSESAGAAHAQEQEEREASPVDDTEMIPEQDEPEAPDMALRAWRDIALKRLGRGKSAGYPFFDTTIPEKQSYELAAVLGHCRSEAEVRAVFAHMDDYRNIKAILGARDDTNPAQLEQEEAFIDPIEAFLAAQVGRIIAARGVDGSPPPKAFWDNEAARLAAMLTPFVQSWAEVGIGEVVNVLSTVGLGIDADVNARAAAWAGEHALELAKKLTDTTKELSKARIKNWLQTGQPLEALADSLSQVISPRWRAELISSTEVTRAFAQASLEIAGEMDVIKRVIWNTARDERVCPICRPLDRQTRSKRPGARFPGGHDSPPAHPRCRCGLSFEV